LAQAGKKTVQKRGLGVIYTSAMSVTLWPGVFCLMMSARLITSSAWSYLPVSKNKEI
jgi:hypothetical protein